MGTKIPWTEKTWNPVIGCTKVSAGCTNCYAERMAYRLWCMGNGAYGSVMDIETNGWNGEVFCRKDRLDIPLHWKKPRRIFVNSMSDTFHPDVPFEFRVKMYKIMDKCKQHTFQVLTKRPEIAVEEFRDFPPPNNMHFGWTAENQPMLDLRTPQGLRIPAAVRFISAEPLLGDIDFKFGGCIPLNTINDYECPSGACYECDASEIRVDQVIIGAESIGGHPGRECKIEWVRNIVRQCKAAGVAVFVKQIHMWRVGPLLYEIEDAAKAALIGVKKHGVKRVLLKYPRDKDLFPVDLRCWEYPKNSG